MSVGLVGNCRSRSEKRKFETGSQARASPSLGWKRAYRVRLKGNTMPSDMSKLRLWSMAGAAAAALGLAAGLGYAGPASAEDGNALSSMFGLFSDRTPGKTDEAIDYQPRPPLVLPPKRDLPPPQAKAPHGADWPNDPDAVARRRAEADSRRPAPQVNLAPPPGMPDSITVKMKDECLKESTTCASDDSFWDTLKNAFTGGTKEVVLKGAEPNRDYLVDPPPGYRRPLVIPNLPPPQPRKEAKSEAKSDAKPGVKPAEPAPAQPPEANLKTADTQASQPAPQPPAPQKDHFGLW
jgi:hypothetical protein